MRGYVRLRWNWRITVWELNSKCLAKLKMPSTTTSTPVSPPVVQKPAPRDSLDLTEARFNRKGEVKWQPLNDLTPKGTANWVIKTFVDFLAVKPATVVAGALVAAPIMGAGIVSTTTFLAPIFGLSAAPVLPWVAAVGTLFLISSLGHAGGKPNDWLSQGIKFMTWGAVAASCGILWGVAPIITLAVVQFGVLPGQSILNHLTSEQFRNQAVAVPTGIVQNVWIVGKNICSSIAGLFSDNGPGSGKPRTPAPA